ncbi:hypothetical protein ACFY3U_25290 [Micromonospora sp. NPDC000089]|uniref:hypothetical protein n=1 Tax=unclassified Micromonospora TaxID=2617518 RepID=UPI0036AA8675
MTVVRDQRTARYGEPTPTGVSVAVGWVVVAGTALLAAAAVPAGDLPTRALLVAVAAGVYAARVADLRAVVAVTALAMATYVGFLAHRFGELTGGGEAWSYAMVIPFAAALGAGYRYMAGATRPDGPMAQDGAVVAPPDDPAGGTRVE